MNERVKRLQGMLKDEEIDALLVTKPENRRYLTGFSGSSGYVVISVDKAVLLTDFRYTEQATEQAPDFEVIEHGREVFKQIASLLQGIEVSRLGFESLSLTYDLYERVKKELSDIELVPKRGLVERLRIVKSEEEIEAIRQSTRIAEESLETVLPLFKPGVSEKEFAAELEYQMKTRGADGTSFQTIVASGKNSSRPHAGVSDRKFQAGDFVTVDFGAKKDGYASDTTRTVVIGTADRKQKDVYYLVLEAQLAALEVIKAGVLGQEVDKVSRDIIEAGGYGKNFGHGLGHGVGLAVHEMPSLAPGYDKPLDAGAVVTVEPGIYIPGFGGVRIEDLVVVREDGYTNLNTFNKELLEL